jgi:DNA-binding NtrC family response regulator
MVMPEMGGRDLFDEIKKIEPRIPLIISSGFSPREDSIQQIIRDGAHFLQKPVSLKNLSEVVEGILAERGV